MYKYLLKLLKFFFYVYDLLALLQEMVRNYKRKTKKGAGTVYSSEDLDKALDDIKNGNKTTRGAALF